MTASLLPEDIARRYSAVPTGLLPDGSLRVLIADPTKVLYSDEFHAALGVPLNLAVAAPHAVEAAIAFLYGQVERGADQSSVEPTEPDEVEPGLEGDEAVPPAVHEHLAESAADAVAEPVVEDAPDVFFAAGLDEIDAVEAASETLVVDDAPEPVAPAEAAGNDVVSDIEDIRDAFTAVEFTEITAVENGEDVLAVEESLEPPAVDEVRAPVAPAEAAGKDLAPDIEDVGDAFTAVEFTEITAVENVEDVLAVEESLESVAPADDGGPSDLHSDSSAVTTAEDGAPESALVERGGVGGLDAMIERALALGASSIHFSPQPSGLVVRARIDGVMRDLDTIPPSDQTSVTSRLETIAQPGTSEKLVDLRVDRVSTKRGDKVTLRVHGGISAPSSLTDLGMAPDGAETVLKAIHQPFGAIVVCGPTGSGRTTTLYAAMHELNTPERTVTTIEDPIEHLTPGIDQIEVDTAAGMTFARGLGAILRTDSDVVLVGEIRDEETAEIAIRAAMTDYLVLSTLQASTAAAGIRRLTELGIEPSMLAATLTCVVAQRLVRRVCGDCRESYYATESDLLELGRLKGGKGPRLLARGRGCVTCGDTGFSGRVGIFEVLPLTGDICALVAKGASTAKIHRAAAASGMRTLREEGIRLCLEGLTTAAEVRRVAGDWAW